MSIEAMKLALEAIEDLRGYRPDIDSAIETLRTAIQQAVPMTDGIEDFTVDVVVKPMGGFAPVNTQGVRVTHNPTGISVTCDVARSQHANRNQAFEKLCAILALRPVQAPMTDEQVDAFTVNGRLHWLGKRQLIRGVEAYYGITAQAKKETP